MRLYIAKRNIDQTEGKGGMVAFGYYRTEAAAVQAVKGQGVMGVGDGDVYLIDDETILQAVEGFEARQKRSNFLPPLDKMIYGYRKDWTGKWNYGFVDNRDAPVNDPEYNEYKRLQRKFEGM